MHWAKRLEEVDALRQPAEELYTGDHWHSILEAYRLARRYSSRTELWVISAGYGLIRSSTPIKAYGATFAEGAADSVWRGPTEGDRRECLRQWWRKLGHESTLRELLQGTGGGALVVAAGATYLSALDVDINDALQRDQTSDRVSVISAGSRGNGALLPVNGGFRALVGGTDSALNARLLVLLAREATAHQFSRSAMAATLKRMATDLPEVMRRGGRSRSDEQIAQHIRALRRRVPGISRTQALRELRSRDIACEQSRFASIWKHAVGKQN